MTKFNLAIILALTAAFISGVNNFLTKLAVTGQDPVIFTFLKNIVVAVFLLSLLLTASRWREILQLDRKQVFRLLAIGLIGGGLPFVLYFTGLSLVPVAHAAFIHKTLFLWVALLAVPILKEKIGWLQFVALILLLIGSIGLFNMPRFTGHIGELMILGATLLWAIENIIAKQALKNCSSLLIAGARMLIGSAVILVVIIAQHKTHLIFSLSPHQWSWAFLTGLLLAGYVLSWYTALKHAPATLVASLLVPATFITNVLHAIFIAHAFPSLQLLSGTLLSFGLVLIISQARQFSPQLNSSSKSLSVSLPDKGG